MKAYAIDAYKAPVTLHEMPDPAFAAASGANWIVRQVIRLGSAKIRRKAKRHGVEYSFLFMRPDGAQLAEVANLAESGVIHPVVDQVFRFDETPAALDRSATGRARGKIVVRGYNADPSD